ncbi:hypothetical protein BD560DRAFT_491236 [Blakeslea trispora]|nr:hypothetical protein BD560DRAFT_491236 [Blakeslea trispora]
MHKQAQQLRFEGCSLVFLEKRQRNIEFLDGLSINSYAKDYFNESFCDLRLTYINLVLIVFCQMQYMPASSGKQKKSNQKKLKDWSICADLFLEKLYSNCASIGELEPFLKAKCRGLDDSTRSLPNEHDTALQLYLLDDFIRHAEFDEAY